MAKYNIKAGNSNSNIAAPAKESAMLRNLRIDGSQNGATLRTRIVRDKTKYNRNVKHKKSLADARDFAYLLNLFALLEETAAGACVASDLRALHTHLEK
ncbi:MAG: hypothetical protein IKS96_09680 [Fibrobacter sp.]|nr:hypothetical protein [Fibrobacter sp.]